MKTLAIYFKNGSTAYFQRVSSFMTYKDSIEFKYFGVTSKANRSARFRMDNIAGYAIEEYYADDFLRPRDGSLTAEEQEFLEQMGGTAQV